MRYLYWIHPINYINFWTWCFSINIYENRPNKEKGLTIFGFEFIFDKKNKGERKWINGWS